jgi:hypothetical protein
VADFAPNYTARYKLIYTVAGLQHSLGLRYSAAMAQSAVTANAVALLNSIFDALSAVMLSSFTLVDAEYSAANSTFFVPVGIDDLVVAGAVSAGIFPMDEIVSTTWAGRSIGGHKGKFVMFGVYWGVSNADFTDFVVTPAEEVAIGTVADLLATAPGLVMNDNLAATFWRERATIKVSDAWVKHRRP